MKKINIFVVGILILAFAGVGFQTNINVDNAIHYWKTSGSVIDDTNTFTNSEDVKTDLSDGLTSTYSYVENSTNDKEITEVSFYDLDNLSSQYKIKFYIRSKTWGDVYLRIYPMNNGVVDTSVYFEQKIKSNKWYEENINDVLKKAIEYGNGNATLRFVTTNDDKWYKISEVYLIRKIENLNDIQILPMGVSITELNKDVENRWRLYANQFFEITNATCGIYNVNGSFVGNANNIEITNYGKDSSLLVKWNSDDTKYEDGKSYKVSCSIQIDNNRWLSGVEQYVYITREKTIFDKIVAVFQKLLGIEQKVNMTYNLSTEINETTHLIRQDIAQLNITNNQTFTNLSQQIQDLKEIMQEEHNSILNNLTETKENLTTIITTYHNEENQKLDDITNRLTTMNETITNNQADIKNYINETFEYIIDFRNENTQYHNQLVDLINSLNETNEQRKVEILNYILGMNTNLSNDLNDIETQITDLHNYIDIRINETQDLINAVNQTIMNKLDLINTIVEDNGNKIDRNYNELMVINSTTNSIYDDIQILKTNTQDILTNQQTILNKLNDIETQITDLETNMNNKFSQVFEKIENQTQTILGINNSIQSHLVQIETNQVTHDTAEQQRHGETQALINSSKNEIITEIQTHDTNLNNKYNEIMNKLNELEHRINEINTTMNITNTDVTEIKNMTTYIYWHFKPDEAPINVETSITKNNGVVTFTTEVRDINNEYVNNALCLLNITDNSGSNIGENIEMKNYGDGVYRYSTALGTGEYSYNVICKRLEE